METITKTPEFGIEQGGPIRHQVLFDLVWYLHKPEISVLEVGSFEGQSALVWSAAIGKHCEKGSVLCIDPWSADYIQKYLPYGPEYVAMAKELQSGEVYRRFCRNITLAHGKAPINHVRGTLQQMVEFWQNRTFDIVYLDGDHSASALSKDIESARALVSVGGILCGDDLEVQGGDCIWDQTVAVADSIDYISYYHPGVTVAVWNAFGRVWMKDGVWAVQKTGEYAWQPPGVK